MNALCLNKFLSKAKKKKNGEKIQYQTEKIFFKDLEGFSFHCLYSVTEKDFISAKKAVEEKKKRTTSRWKT